MLMGKSRGPSTTRDMKTTTASNTDLASAGRAGEGVAAGFDGRDKEIAGDRRNHACFDM
jgi:hypothetical protein